MIVDAHATAAGFGNGVSNFLRIDFDDKTRARGFYLKRFLCQRQNLRGLVADARVAALRFDIRAKTFQRCARFVNPIYPSAGRIDRWFDMIKGIPRPPGSPGLARRAPD